MCHRCSGSGHGTSSRETAPSERVNTLVVFFFFLPAAQVAAFCGVTQVNGDSRKHVEPHSGWRCLCERTMGWRGKEGASSLSSRGEEAGVSAAFSLEVL